MSTDFPIFTKTFHSSVYPSLDLTKEALSAKNKVVLVTGGGRGIGKAITLAFAKAGARAIVILGRSAESLQAVEKEISGSGTLVRSFAADVCDTEAVAKAFASTKEEFKTIDIVVNNAATLHKSTLEATSVDEYWHHFEIGVKGTLNVMQAFARSTVDRDSSNPATFININTAGVLMPAYPTWSNYTASKLATFSMTKFLGTETDGRIRTFSIHPGRVDTDMAAISGVPTFEDPELPGAFCVWLAATREADFLQDRLVAANWDVDELLQRRSEIEEKGLLKMKFEGLSM